MARACDTKPHNLATVSAPINPSFGRVSDWVEGVTLDFARK